MRSERGSTVKRWAFKLTLATFAGAVITWAVAWACALWSRNEGEFSESRQELDWWHGELPEEWISQTRAASAERSTYRINRTWGADIDGATHNVYIQEAGWPLTALRDDATLTWYSRQRIESESRWSVSAPRWTLPYESDRRLPLRPIPLGFALNSLLAASLILGLTEGAGAWRRRARRRKGQCPSCGYDRAGIDNAATACPECGKVVA